MELTSRADNAAGLTLGCPPGRFSRRWRCIDELASDNHDNTARRDDYCLHPGDGFHQARGVRAPANRLTWNDACDSPWPERVTLHGRLPQEAQITVGKISSIRCEEL